MIILSDSRDRIFNSSDPNRVPKTPLKNPAVYAHTTSTELAIYIPYTIKPATNTVYATRRPIFAFGGPKLF